jgi:hypothetical protein
MSIPAIPPDGVPAAQVAEYEAAIQSVFENTLQLASASDWTTGKVDGDISFFSRSVPGSSFTMIKSEISIPLPFEVILKRLAILPLITPDMPAAQRDGALRRLLLVPEPNEFNNGFLYLALESGSRFVSNRDFLLYRKHFEKDGTHYFILTSIVNDAIAPPYKDFVRGKILVQALVFDQNAAGEPRLRFIAHADPAGSIPAMVYNAVSQTQGYLIKKLKTELLAAK